MVGTQAGDVNRTVPRPSASAIRGKHTSGDGVRTVVRADDGKIPVWRERAWAL